MPSRPDAGRDLRIDFFRGVVLIIIFVTHTNPNLFKKLVPTAFGFSDAAEAFVFLSGYVAGVAYLKVLRAGGFRAVQLRILKRCGTIYAAHIVTQFLCVALALQCGLGLSDPMVNAGLFETQPAEALRRVASLSYFAWAFDVLPLYLAILPFLPAALWVGTRFGFRWVFAASFVLYAAVQAAPAAVVLPSVWGATWYFNPFAWQFLFFLGTCLAARPSLIPDTARESTGLLAAAVAFLLTAAVVKVGYAAAVRPDFFRDLWAILGGETTLALPHLQMNAVPGTRKGHLGVLRLLHFLTLAYVCTRAVNAAWCGTGWRAAVVRCGQHSLEVFCLGTVAVYAANAFLATYGQSLAWQFVTNVVGCSAILAAGWVAHMFKPLATLGRPAVEPPASAATPTDLRVFERVPSKEDASFKVGAAL
jgi:hypothetical protein